MTPSFNGGPLVEGSSKATLSAPVFEFDFVANQRHFLVNGFRRVHRDNGQGDLCAFGSANHLDNFVQRHAHDIDRFGVALRHRHDAVVLLILPLFLAGPSLSSIILQ